MSGGIRRVTAATLGHPGPGLTARKAAQLRFARMDLALVPLLRCPTCSGPLDPHPFAGAEGPDCETGLLACQTCRGWYPIAGSVLDLLPEGHAEAGVRADFFAEHRSRIEALGLPAPAIDRLADDGFVAQAHQREHFDDLARREDEFSYGALGRQPFQLALRELTYHRWRPLVHAGSVVLDIGCADGISTFDILGPGITAIGFDLSREALLTAARRARSRGLANVSFFVGDANSIPLVDASADCVLCYGSLHHVPEPERTLSEAARVLPDGGLYLGLENNPTPLRPIFDMLMRRWPLWREEAGAEALIGRADLERWTADSPLRLSGSPLVFVPPHLCNKLNLAGARLLLSWTDAVFQQIPGVRDWGGLMAIEGRKLGHGPTG
jgi:SAM-dependent methyltransferase/uncharacterized protein YbaR (Trm112 family)